MIVDVTEENFNEYLPCIRKSVEQAAFVSVDLEFLGLPSPSGQDSVSLFDTPCERYEKLSNIVRRYPPCQLGLACFLENEKGYVVDVYCIALFKRVSDRDFCVSPPAAMFLAKHKFDFNKFFSYGITYCNRSELSKIKSGIERGDIDVNLFKDGFYDQVQDIKMRIIREVEKRTDSTPSGSFLDLNDNIRLKEPLFIDLPKANCPFEKPLTQLEEALLIFTLLEEFPNFEINLKDGRTLFIIDDSAHKGLNEQNTKWIKNFNKLLTEICGVSQIFYYLSKVKPPLIVHNSLLDLLHIYNSFEDNLPETYNEWKCAIHALFPVIIDTKVLATTLREELMSGGCADLSLQALGAFLNSDLSSKILPVRTSLNIGTEGMKQFVKDNKNYHNAAFDALMTGDVFVKLTHMLVLKRCSATLEQQWPLRKLLVACRKDVVNKIPIPLIDAECCNLEGEDAQGHRPDIIRVFRTRSQEPASGLAKKSLFCRAWSLFADVHEISDDEFERVQNDLVHVFGSFRVDVRLGPRKRSLEIATNTASTYARVCAFFAPHNDYRLADDVRRTFEQRLCTPRFEKDRKKDIQAGLTIGLNTVLVLSVTTLMWIGLRLTRNLSSLK
ncbi:hypothetical protein RB195_013452 [Necator americanus]